MEAEEKLEKIRDICDEIRCTGISSSLDNHIEKMRIELEAQKQLVIRIERILDDNVKSNNNKTDS